MKGIVRLQPALTILAQSLMAVLFGFLGLLLAMPALAATVVIVKRLYVEEVANSA
jgi:predicted PurR-regulated permease PerM